MSSTPPSRSRHTQADVSRKPAPDRGWTRRPLHRIYEIHTWLKAGRYPNCQQLARELEMTPKTVQRDINFMRYELNLPLAYDDQRRGYYYERPVGDFPLLQLSRRELVTLFLARQALSTVRGTRLEQELAQTFERLTAGLSDEVSFSWSELDAAFSVRATGVVEADARLFGALTEAILHRREITFAYRKLGAGRPEHRRVHPYHLGQVDHGWYLFGFDLARQAVRTFALPRITDLQVATTPFSRPADFNLLTHLGGSFGVWNYPETQTGTHDIRIVFRGYAARVVAERRWHPSQEIAPHPDEKEAIELSLRLRGLEEVARWILSWGRWAEVVEPETLRSRIRKEAAAMLNRETVGPGDENTA
jgi:predicted DNA-binding transcriptional regulator YafY